MPFLNLSIYNFRNLENKTIDLLSKEVYFVGENGQGKSNLLEALYISSYASSFRTKSENELIKKGESEYSLRGFFREESEKTTSISVSYKSGKKRIEKNGKTVKDRKELINAIPCVLFCHDDLEFSVGEPERRRFFIDQCLSMYDVVYIDFIRKYKQILKNRNIILKEEKYDLLEMYDIPLIKEGLEIQKRRNKAIFKFNTIFTLLYKDISGIDGVKISYEPSWKSDNEAEILEYVLSKRDVDKVMGTTMTGPHRDKIYFVKDGKNFVSTASTGQRRLIALILRIAQATYYSEITGKNPVLLMDDVLLELDPNKRQSVTALLPTYDQLFCTFLPGEPYERYKHSTTKIYNIKNGDWFE